VVPFKLTQEKWVSASTNERHFLEDQHPSGTTNNGWVQIGIHTQARVIVQGGQARGRETSGPRLGEVDIEDQMAMGIASYFREAPHGVMQTHAQPPRPRILNTSDLRQGSRPAAGRIGRCPKVGRALLHESLAYSSISGYVAKWLRGIIAQWHRLPTASFPVMDPLPRQE
jgi:hypothetical protein